MALVKLEPKHLRNGMVVTPKNINEIWEFCKRSSTPADATIAVNLAFNLVAEYMENGFPVEGGPS